MKSGMGQGVRGAPGLLEWPRTMPSTTIKEGAVAVRDPQDGRPAPAARGAAVSAFSTPELKTLVADMFETMAAVNGASLAAPQIGVDLQLVIFGFSHNARYPRPRPCLHGAHQPRYRGAAR